VVVVGKAIEMGGPRLTDAGRGGRGVVPNKGRLKSGPMLSFARA